MLSSGMEGSIYDKKELTFFYTKGEEVLRDFPPFLQTSFEKPTQTILLKSSTRFSFYRNNIPLIPSFPLISATERRDEVGLR